MLTIHHLKNSRSQSIVWLAEELGMPYKLESYDRAPGAPAPPAYKALHPLGRAPLIRDGELLLVETGAIIEYMVTKYGGGRLAPKPDSADYPLYLLWLHFAEGSAMPHQVNLRTLDAGGDTANPERARATARVDQDFAFISDALAKAPYFAGGSFTAADIAMTIPLRFALSKRDAAAYPHLAAYTARIAERPAFKKAASVG